MLTSVTTVKDPKHHLQIATRSTDYPQQYIILKHSDWAWGDASVVGNLYCSCRGPRFNSNTRIRWLTTACKSSSKGCPKPQAHARARAHTHIFIYTPIYTHYTPYIYTSSIMYNSLMYSTHTQAHTPSCFACSTLLYTIFSSYPRTDCLQWKDIRAQLGPLLPSTPSPGHRANGHQVKIKQFTFPLSIPLTPQDDRGWATP